MNTQIKPLAVFGCATQDCADEVSMLARELYFWPGYDEGKLYNGELLDNLNDGAYWRDSLQVGVHPSGYYCENCMDEFGYWLDVPHMKNLLQVINEELQNAVRNHLAERKPRTYSLS